MLYEGRYEVNGNKFNIVKTKCGNTMPRTSWAVQQKKKTMNIDRMTYEESASALLPKTSDKFNFRGLIA